MSIEVKIIADSVSLEGIRLTTFQLRYPRFIHPEFMTHRVFGRNASSSRAIPILRLLLTTVRDMAMPVEWGSNKPGMQAGEPLTGFRRWIAERIWRGTGWFVAGAAWLMSKTGAHKQVVNRMIEPWSHISVVVTATDWQNFFELRTHWTADPTFRELATKMKEAYDHGQPKFLNPGQWHLPYIDHEADLMAKSYVKEKGGKLIEVLKRMSAARCARVSYLRHDNKLPSVAEDLKLFSRLAEDQPVHASPLEHQATPDKLWSRNRWGHQEEHGNLRGYRQFRKMVPGEAVYG